jgi:hypothetical protein
MTEVTRVGASIVTDKNDKWLVMREKVKELPEHYMIVGLMGGAYNAYGERIATYGYTQAGSRGSHPNWVFRARKATDESVFARSHRIMHAAVHGAPDMDKVVNDIASHAAEVFQGVVDSEGLIDSGDLKRAITWTTRTHPGNPPKGGTKSRISRVGGDDALSDRQRLYMLYHRGRSRTFTKMRKSMSFADFRQKYGAKYMMASRAERIGIARDMAAHRAQAAKAASSTVPGRFNQSQAAMMHSLIMGSTSRTGQDRATALQSARADARVQAKAQRAARAEQDRQYVASVRSSLSGRKGGRRR